jgi:hypothetical protein
MRRFVILSGAALGFVACMDPDNREIVPSEPFWVEWPAEVRAGTAFDVQLLGYGPGCYPSQELRIDVDRSADAVTFRALWFVSGENNVLCLRDVGFYDTTVTVPGLAAAADQTYELRTVASDRPPVRTIGSVLVRPTAPVDTDRRNAAGWTNGFTDIEGCAVMQRNFDVPIPVDNPPAATWQGSVRGYFFTPAAPLCGQTRAFHVVDLR